MIWFFLLSGLFLGWSLGANDAANVFGTAVGTRMVKFKSAALVATIFVILGSVIGGAGTTHTLGQLGAVNAMAGSFTVALAAGVSVTWMTKLKLPVSTTQAIVGAILGWNLFTASSTNFQSLIEIVASWVVSPVLAAIFSFIIFKLSKNFLEKSRIHLLKLDMLTRVSLILVGAFGAYSLGANNIANVMGVFVPASPFNDFQFSDLITIGGSQQLFLLGALAIGVGIYTYSYRVISTVGGELYKLTPNTALVIVLSESLVLFIFASQTLEKWLISLGIPPIPLVPVSSSQAVIGAIIGISLSKGGKGINYNILGRIATGWVITPLLAGIISFVALFFVQNVFEQKVVRSIEYNFSPVVLEKLSEEGIRPEKLQDLKNKEFNTPSQIRYELEKHYDLTERQISTILSYAKKDSFVVDSMRLNRIEVTRNLSDREIGSIKKLHGKSFGYQWQFNEALQKSGYIWKPATDKTSGAYNKILNQKKKFIYKMFRVKEIDESPQF